VEDAQVKKVLLCSGKLYFELADNSRKKTGKICHRSPGTDLSFATKTTGCIARKYSKATWFWVQEEPLNMGAASFLQMNLKSINFGVISRNASAANAMFYFVFH
jgi:2-oxoglutarate dehydrogenase E1 component